MDAVATDKMSRWLSRRADVGGMAVKGNAAQTHGPGTKFDKINAKCV